MKARIANPTEEQEHLKLMAWVAQQPTIARIFTHHANERKCHPWQGAKFKRLGVKAGYPDFTLLLPSSRYHGLAIELKRKGKIKISPEQTFWINYLNSVGYSAHFAKGADEAIQIISNYLNDCH